MTWAECCAKAVEIVNRSVGRLEETADPPNPLPRCAAAAPRRSIVHSPGCIQKKNIVGELNRARALLLYCSRAAGRPAGQPTRSWANTCRQRHRSAEQLNPYHTRVRPRPRTCRPARSWEHSLHHTMVGPSVRRPYGSAELGGTCMYAHVLDAWKRCVLHHRERKARYISTVLYMHTDSSRAQYEMIYKDWNGESHARKGCSAITHGRGESLPPCTYE